VWPATQLAKVVHHFVLRLHAGSRQPIVDDTVGVFKDGGAKLRAICNPDHQGAARQRAEIADDQGPCEIYRHAQHSSGATISFSAFATSGGLHPARARDLHGCGLGKNSLSEFLDYDVVIRKIICSTNAIKSLPAGRAGPRPLPQRAICRGSAPRGAAAQAAGPSRRVEAEAEPGDVCRVADHAGGPHHRVLSTAVSTDQLVDFTNLLGVELLITDGAASRCDFADRIR
jgi:hypothetical protein